MSQDKALIRPKSYLEDLQSRSQGTREDSTQVHCESNAFLLAMSPTPKRPGGGARVGGAFWGRLRGSN